ncbi:MAG TPA: hypothetical protein VK524_09215 [Polyangiaceae bacterium]|nr:hypothetical protein [Polyangiaceae bacterium]
MTIMDRVSCGYRLRRTQVSTLGVAVGFALLLAGCPAKESKSKAAPEPCTKFGQSCEYSPGKLGTCVRREECTGGNCFVCQSQH